LKLEVRGKEARVKIKIVPVTGHEVLRKRWFIAPLSLKLGTGWR
jgi:hypothetical protein